MYCKCSIYYSNQPHLYVAVIAFSFNVFTCVALVACDPLVPADRRRRTLWSQPPLRGLKPRVRALGPNPMGSPEVSHVPIQRGICLHSSRWEEPQPWLFCYAPADWGRPARTNSVKNSKTFPCFCLPLAPANVMTYLSGYLGPTLVARGCTRGVGPFGPAPPPLRLRVLRGTLVVCPVRRWVPRGDVRICQPPKHVQQGADVLFVWQMRDVHSACAARKLRFCAYHKLRSHHLVPRQSMGFWQTCCQLGPRRSA